MWLLDKVPPAQPLGHPVHVLPVTLSPNTKRQNGHTPSVTLDLKDDTVALSHRSNAPESHQLIRQGPPLQMCVLAKTSDTAGQKSNNTPVP